MTPDKNHPVDEPEDHGVLEDAVADTTAIGVAGTRTSQVRVTLPRGYEDLDDDADVVDDTADLVRGKIVLDLPGLAPAVDETVDAELIAETGEIDEDAVAAARARIGEALVAARAAISADLPDEPEGPAPGPGDVPPEDADEPRDEGDEPADDEPADDRTAADARQVEAGTADAEPREDETVETETVGDDPGPGGPAADGSRDDVPGAGDREEPEPVAAPAAGTALARADAVPEPPARSTAGAETERAVPAPSRDETEVPRPAVPVFHPGAHAADDNEKDEAAVSAADEDDKTTSPAGGSEGASGAVARAPRFVARPVESKKVNVTGAETADQLTSDRLVEPGKKVKAEPEGAAWRSLVFRATRGVVNPGDSARVRARKELTSRIAAPLHGGARFVPVVSRKGGVGKTTVTTLLGMALADARDDRIIAVDANPDRGTLAERVAGRSGRTVRDVVRDHQRISGYADISDLVSRDETRLDVLASDTDPQVAQAFDDSDYRTVARVAAHYYSVVLTDTGTGIVHSVMEGTLDLADELVVVAGLSVDEARLASETLTWLEAHGRGDLVERAVVVLNQSSPGAPLVRLAELESHFSSRVRAVVRLPYDPAIATGGAITWAELRTETRDAARELAARVVEGLRGSTRPAVATKGAHR